MENPKPDWHLQEWITHFGKKQHSLIKELRWDNKKANDVWHGRQRYNRDDLNAVAAWLGVQPYELLMPPAEALFLREVRATARGLVEAERRAMAETAAIAPAVESPAGDQAPAASKSRRRKRAS